MDEAERCHKLAYIAYGRLLAQGTAAEVIARQDLTTWAMLGPDLAALSEQLQGQPGVEQIAAFGDDAPRHRQRRARARDARCAQATRAPAARVEPVDTGLEDVFIHLMQQATDNWGRRSRASADLANVGVLAARAGGRSCSRSSCSCARDRITFAMIIGMPIIQLDAVRLRDQHRPEAPADRGDRRRTTASSRAASSRR